MIRLLVLIFASFAVVPSASCADFPSKTITLIVPYAAGGSNDTLSRILAEHMSKSLGQPVIVDNEPGAAGTTASTRAARAAADGYTIIMGNMGTHGAAPAQYPDLKYDPISDFTPIGLAAEVPAIIVTRKDFPANNLAEFSAYLRANADKVNEAHVGVGAPTYLFCTLLQSLLGVQTGRVPYRGGAPAMNDLIGGQVDFSCISLSGAIAQIQSGTLKAIAIASPQRADILPDLPTTIEGGLPQFVVSTWNALFAPKGLPPATLAKLNDALNKALDDPTTRRRLAEMGLVIPNSARRSPEFLGEFVKAEVPRWGKIVASSLDKQR
ncbi:tripartite tricarboxylate transporter substrate binding protein BugD [Bradyrhizobium diazoefficiens]|jgi:tripartite-type tricarboxylate transporter receptor subunit TctC|nr:tripartite tricarboxylate transporter substrate-binding protein [Bradyrhizobium diazoefficiens]UCF53377.1 MAG: tripartite tricarboxylate transporter substrate binding protein BugD [Bradyrhizobium sp.]MBR0962953.1 tripartite tricarboxylate transporter substrate binding protein BugD [Bradyrhizobium diazoefficiens]MBR0977113.1 tripartite tricarboxylate transporter substrate binding protein BugD [Bradyrhizobium diazoefficiens]MBR1005758.1 tripartite tricarboxylate transporter substrate binding p